MGTFVIAEAGVNHNGDEKLAHRMIDVAKSAGADAIKFQTFSAEKLVIKGASLAQYQKRSVSADDQFEMLKRLELSHASFASLFSHCQDVGIEFMSTPFDEEAASYLLDIGMKRIKIPSGEITNLPFIEYMASKDVQIILSTGMSFLSEVIEALECIVNVRNLNGFQRSSFDMVTVLHCTSNYPASPENVNLRAMRTIAETTGFPVGYSDHTLGIAVSTAAVALGATVIEKHFTLDKNLSGPDHSASLDPVELAQMVSGIRCVELALGSPEKVPLSSELEVMSVARRSIYYSVDLPTGSVISDSDLLRLRPAIGVAPRHQKTITGKVLSRNVIAGAPVSWDDFQ